MTSISDRTTGRGNGVAPGKPLGRDKAMTLQDMGWAVWQMTVHAKEQGYNPKDITIKAINFSAQYSTNEIEIDDDGQAAWAEVYFSL